MTEEESKPEEIMVAETETDENGEAQKAVPICKIPSPDLKSIIKAAYDPVDLSYRTGGLQWFFMPLLPALCFFLFSVQLFSENFGTGVRAGNPLILLVGALAGYSFALIGSIIVFAVFRSSEQKMSFAYSVALLSGCFVAPTFIELVGAALKLFIRYPVSTNIGVFGMLYFMVPLSFFTVKNSGGKLLPVLCLTVVLLVNAVIWCLMIKIGVSA